MSKPVVDRATHRGVMTEAVGRGRVEATRPLLVTLAIVLWALWSAVNPPRPVTDSPATALLRPAQSMSIAPGVPSPVKLAADPRLRTPHPDVASLTDDQIAERLFGRWTTTYHGTQTIEKRSDRTAQLEIVFDWVASFFYGERMRLDLRWKVENGVLTNHIERGEPQANVDRLIADYSRECSYLVLELGADTLLLQEINDPDSFHRWTRLR